MLSMSWINMGETKCRDGSWDLLTGQCWWRQLASEDTLCQITLSLHVFNSPTCLSTSFTAFLHFWSYFSLEGKKKDKEDEEHRLKLLRGGPSWSSFLQMYELHGRERNWFVVQLSKLNCSNTSCFQKQLLSKCLLYCRVNMLPNSWLRKMCLSHVFEDSCLFGAGGGFFCCINCGVWFFFFSITWNDWDQANYRKLQKFQGVWEQFKSVFTKLYSSFRGTRRSEALFRNNIVL